MRPSITSCVPENTSTVAITQPQPYAGPRSVTHSQTTPANAARPASAVSRPMKVATRSGSSEKLSHALSHSRTSRRSV